MYQNLKAEMTRFNIKNLDVSKKLNITPGTASLKINGKSIITLDEAFLIQELIFEKTNNRFSIEYLFGA